MGGGAVVGRIDGGGAVELVVGGTDVGGWVVGGGSVVAVVVSTGGDVAGGDVAGGDVASGLVPVFRGAVVTTGGAVVPEVPDGGGPTVVFVSMDVDVDEVDEAFDVVVGRTVVVGTSDDVGVWLATCCLDDVSSPTATSNTRAARAMVARA